ncbi:hypothetical protein [Streptomyces benahoarensis]|uniref:Uncharacterized protein n=1 Tax=Streptomyces benahoarensis TaxID=2595054 RepID=A0A553YMP0_9ACTN|nr:hypothetical protein [Streptomyces benahoarensis]TSB16413.1 hypothetical protein FNJ62_28265 [Streptomyces benahoarensis]TSB30456.1 hypothetical protein FNZ23_26145 [Streptomyces benahoarensis]
MTSEAESLRALATDVRHLLDETIKIATRTRSESSSRWRGPYAEEVRGELSVHTRKLSAMADGLNAEAGRRKKDDA